MMRNKKSLLLLIALLPPLYAKGQLEPSEFSFKEERCSQLIVKLRSTVDVNNPATAANTLLARLQAKIFQESNESKVWVKFRSINLLMLVGMKIAQEHDFTKNFPLTSGKATLIVALNAMNMKYSVRIYCSRKCINDVVPFATSNTDRISQNS